MSEMVERVARALAKRHGDNWDDIPDHKGHWVKQRGQFNGRFRDVNERFRSDYLDEASAAIEVVQAWQPIETAPRDGTSVLVAHDEGMVSEAAFDIQDDNWWLAQTGPHDFDPSNAIYPTRWQPLPAPPVEQAKTEVVG